MFCSDELLVSMLSNNDLEELRHCTQETFGLEQTNFLAEYWKCHLVAPSKGSKVLQERDELKKDLIILQAESRGTKTSWGGK